MPKDVGSLNHGILRGDSSIGPDLNHQPIVVRPLADPGGFDRVPHPANRREQRVDGNHANRLVFFFIIFAGAKSTPHLDLEFGLELHLLVERANMLVGVDDLDDLVALDIGRGDGAFLVGRKQKGVRVATVGLEQYLFQVENDLRDILDHAGNGSELVSRAIDLHRGDGRSLEGTEQHATHGIADGMAVTGFQGLGNESGIGIGGARLVASQRLGHFKTT